MRLIGSGVWFERRWPMVGWCLLLVLLMLAGCVWCGVRSPRSLLVVSVVAMVGVPMVMLLSALGWSYETGKGGMPMMIVWGLSLLLVLGCVLAFRGSSYRV